MKKKIMFLVAIVIAMMCLGYVCGQNYSTIMWDDHPTYSNVPYCIGDSIKCVPPSGVTGIIWSGGTVLHGDTLVIPSGFDGQVDCFYTGGVKSLRLRPIAPPVIPLFSPTDTLCGIETKILNAGNVSIYGFMSYLWNTGATTQTILADTAGIYSVTVSNLCGLVNKSSQIWKFNTNKPDLGPDITACEGSNLILSPGTGYSDYLWTGGTIGSTLAPTTSGTYIVQTTNTSDACIDKDTIIITFLHTDNQNIEMVTIDTSNGNNKIIWKNLYGSAQQVVIYRENTTNTYLPVGIADYSALSWTDTVNSRNQAWRYKIVLSDTCGNPGLPSGFVQSIHSWVTAVVGGGYTIQWTPYMTGAKEVTAYNIYKGETISTLEYMTYVSGNVTVYTLTEFPDSIYVIGADLGSKSATDDALSNWISKSDVNAINDYQLSDLITIAHISNRIEIITDVTIKNISVYNSLGQVILSTKEKSFIIPQGIFILEINTNKGNMYKKIQ